MKRAWHLGILLSTGALLGPSGLSDAWAGVSGAPQRQEAGRETAAAHKAVQAMREACSVNMMSRVYRPQPDCAPRRAAVVKLGDRAVVALRAELLQHIASLQAPPAAAQQQAALAAPRPRLLRRAGHASLVGALREIATPAAVEALLDVVTAPGAEQDPWSVLMPASAALKQLTGAAIEVSPKSRQEMIQIGDAWRSWRQERQEQQEQPQGVVTAS